VGLKNARFSIIFLQSNTSEPNRLFRCHLTPIVCLRGSVLRLTSRTNYAIFVSFARNSSRAFSSHDSLPREYCVPSAGNNRNCSSRVTSRDRGLLSRYTWISRIAYCLGCYNLLGLINEYRKRLSDLRDSLEEWIIRLFHLKPAPSIGSGAASPSCAYRRFLATGTANHLGGSTDRCLGRRGQATYSARRTLRRIARDVSWRQRFWLTG
jgi:hypothetical protein